MCSWKRESNSSDDIDVPPKDDTKYTMYTHGRIVIKRINIANARLLTRFLVQLTPQAEAPVTASCAEGALQPCLVMCFFRVIFKMNTLARTFWVI